MSVATVSPVARAVASNYSAHRKGGALAQLLPAFPQAGSMMAARHMSLLSRFSGTAMQALRTVPEGTHRITSTNAFSVQAATSTPEAAQEIEKKPNSAYINYVSDHYKTVKAKHPKAQSKEIMAMIGADWKKLAAHTKDKYNAAAAKAKAAYDEKYPPGSQPKRVSKPKKSKAGTGDDSPKPKRNVSAYNVYVQQRLPHLKKSGDSATSAMSLVAKEWKTLSQSEKDQWKTKAAQASA